MNNRQKDDEKGEEEEEGREEGEEEGPESGGKKGKVEKDASVRWRDEDYQKKTERRRRRRRRRCRIERRDYGRVGVGKRGESIREKRE